MEGLAAAAAVVLLVAAGASIASPLQRRASALALAGFALLALSLFSFTIDDAYISLRYGRNLAAGLGPVFDAQPAREGYSSPLWVALSAVPFLFHLSADAAAVGLKAAGLVFGLLTIVSTSLLVRAHSGSARATHTAVVLLASLPWLAFWSVGGLETPLYCALIVWSLLLHAREHQSGRSHAGCAVPLALITLTRPEGIAVALAILLADPVAGLFRGKDDARGPLRPMGGSWRRALPALLVVGACWGAHEWWRISYYGSALPSTFQAKAGLTLHALKTRALELLPLAAAMAPLIVAAAWTRAARAALPNAAWGAAFALAAFAVVPRLEGGPGFRYEVPLFPLLAAAAAMGLDTAFREGRARLTGRLVTPVLVIALLLPMIWLWRPARFSPSTVEIALGRWLGAYAPEARLAVYDLGAVPYFSAAPWVFDTNPAGPLSPFLHRAYELDELVRWSPSFLVLPPESADPSKDRLAGLYLLPAFKRDYVLVFDLETEDGYRMLVWKRRDAILREGAVPAAEAAGLYQRRVSRSTGGRPKYSYALAVATRPREVRSRNPAWIRNGS